MKKIHILYFCIISLLGSFSFYSCETTELDLTEDPNGLKPDQANADFLLNAIQQDFAKLIHSFGETGGEVTRLINMDGRNYQNAYAATDFENEWEEAYQQILADIRLLTPLAKEAEQFHHMGITQVLEAYTMVTLVDFFGSVPYSEAIQGLDNLNPNVDEGAEIYNDALELLDSATVNFGKEAALEPTFDLYYAGDWDKWIDAANTIKMKIYLQTRLLTTFDSKAKFDEIVASGNFIKDETGDFQFNWGSSIANPDTRHPHYVDNYTPTGAADYMSNWLMDYMLNNKQTNAIDIYNDADPRTQYYFYRQASVVPNDPTLINCIAETAPEHYVDAGVVFCSLQNGYWGRDHGDDDGIPPDTQSRTAYGVYPIGGRFDDGWFKVIAAIDEGGKGKGITPIMLSSWVDFMQAEMALEVDNDAGAAQAFIESGIQKSFTKVRSFRSLDAEERDISQDLLLPEPELSQDADYIQEVSAMFVAASDAEKLNILAAEYFVTLFGNGIDAYNFYRRTGAPTNIQPNIEPDPGGYIRSFFYPANFANRNASVDQKSGVTDQVFWDTNPAAGFPEAN